MLARIAATLVCSQLLSPAHAQSLGPTPETLNARSTLVLVPTLVRNKAGELVYTLNAGDFTLTDDSIPQKLTLEQDTGGEPLALVVVLEVGGAGAREFNKFASIAPPMAPMLESIIGNVPHKVAVVTFDSHAVLQQDFTQDIDTAAKSLEALTPGCTRQHHLDDCASPLAVRNVPLGDNGAAILDSIGFAVDLLRKQPLEYRRAILLVSQTLDRGSQISIDNAIRVINDTNTTIYSIAYSTGKSEAVHHASRELPTQPGGLWMENPHPNPPHGCMGKDPNPDPDATHNKAIKAYDCATQLLPPLALAKMAAITTADGLKRNVPETVAKLTGGEYFKLTDAKKLDHDLATISNHIPNRYILSFQPQSPHPGLHTLDLHLKDYPDLRITARTSYWADEATVSPEHNP